MKTKIIVIVMSMLLILPMTAFADEQLVDAGVTPDSWLYSFDQLAEEIELYLESDPLEGAKLLDEFAEERLAESNEMTTIGETELAEETLNEYQETVEEVANKIEEAIEEGENVTEVIDEISDRTEIREDVLNDTIENLPEEVRAIVEEKIEASNLKLTIVKNVLVEKVGGDFTSVANANGLNVRETLAIKSMANQTGKTTDEVMALFIENGKDIGLTIAALGLTGEAMKFINEDFKAAKDQIKDTFKTEKEASKEQFKLIKEAKKEEKKSRDKAKEKARLDEDLDEDREDEDLDEDREDEDLDEDRKDEDLDEDRKDEDLDEDRDDEDRDENDEDEDE